MKHILEGNISVKAAILSPYRVVDELIVDEKKHTKDLSYIIKQANERKIKVTKTTREAIDKLAEGTTHGGCIAICQDRTFQTLSDLPKKESLFLALVEGIEDPFNFGYVLRNLYAAGCDGVLIGKRNWTSAAATVAKSSAGASEIIPLIIMEDVESQLKQLKAAGITLICAERKDAISLYTYTFPSKVCIAIGGEMRGLSLSLIHISSTKCFPNSNCLVVLGTLVLALSDCVS